MEIDLEKAKQEFLKYTQKFDLTKIRIKSKQGHSLRVMENSKQIAEKLELSENEIELATAIGLLHDIARFEQYTQYGTYWDAKSLDHGDYGVKILEKDIRNYIETDKYDKIIKIAIKNHNKFQIEKGLTEKEELFAKIIRDADKLDILYEVIEVYDADGSQIDELENAEISNNTIENFRKCTLANRDKREENYTLINEKIEILAFIFDINFNPTLQIIKERDYINKIIDKYKFKKEDTKNKMEEIRKIANNYIEMKINN